MTPVRSFGNPEAQVVELAQTFSPSLMPVYLKWTAVWRGDPILGRGRLPAPVGDTLRLGDGLFWDVVNWQEALVVCYLAPAVRDRLLQAREKRP